MSHLGRPKGKFNEQFSLKNIVSEIEITLNKKIIFSTDCIGDDALSKSNALQPGEILLLENLRFHSEEENGDVKFAEKLSKLGDAFVNDAFGTAHRAHASTAIIAQFFPSTKFFGLLMAKELKAIDKVLNSGEKPVTAIIGGSKVSSKITIIENILPVIDNLIIGGGMAFTFIKAMGGKIGNSLIEEDKMQLALDIIEKAKIEKVNIYLPVDAVIADYFSNDATIKVCDIYEIPENWMGLDVGPKSNDLFHDVLLNSKTILWNGPAGVFEMSNFAKGTISLGEAIAEATNLGAFSLVGGGDSVAFVKQNNYTDKVSYVSTGGGAMLESLEGLELPGVAAINN
jgi:phosphoglycerate kinase